MLHAWKAQIHSTIGFLNLNHYVLLHSYIAATVFVCRTVFNYDVSQSSCFPLTAQSRLLKDAAILLLFTVSLSTQKSVTIACTETALFCWKVYFYTLVYSVMFTTCQFSLYICLLRRGSCWNFYFVFSYFSATGYFTFVFIYTCTVKWVFIAAFDFKDSRI